MFRAALFFAVMARNKQLSCNNFVVDSAWHSATARPELLAEELPND
jgi:hypothetical protein